MTKQLQNFSIATFIISIIHFSIIERLNLYNQWDSMLFTGMLYGLSLFCVGWYFGRNDAHHTSKLALGFRYHAATFVVSNLVDGTFIVLFQQSNRMNFLIQTIGWGIGLAIHYFLARKTIKGYKKEELFQ